MQIIHKIMALILLCCAAQSFAASDQTISKYADDFMTALNQKVTLTEEQKKALRPVLLTNLNAREDVISSYIGQKGMGVKMQIRDALQPINEKMQSEAQDILNAEQFDAFKQVQSNNQDAVRARINREF